MFYIEDDYKIHTVCPSRMISIIILFSSKFCYDNYNSSIFIQTAWMPLFDRLNQRWRQNQDNNFEGYSHSCKMSNIRKWKPLLLFLWNVEYKELKTFIIIPVDMNYIFQTLLYKELGEWILWKRSQPFVGIATIKILLPKFPGFCNLFPTIIQIQSERLNTTDVLPGDIRLIKTWPIKKN